MSNAKIINVSPRGMKLRTDESIPLRSYVHCNDEILQIRGSGSVRYCNYVSGKYEVGLEFSGGTGWTAS